MTNKNKQLLLTQVLQSADPVEWYRMLKEIRAFKTDYLHYMTTDPINADKELERLESADYDLCAALLMMLLREEQHRSGSLQSRRDSGELATLVTRMIQFLD
ncbi:MAG: DUF6508 domain-containing protein [Culicoidibacterales bacterium]